MTQGPARASRYGTLAVVGGLLALAVSACGTTVPMSQRVTAESGSGGSGDLAAAGGPQGPGAVVPGGPRQPAAGTAGGPAGPVTPGTTGAGVDTGPTSLPVQGASGRGYTPTTLTIGVPVDSGTGAFASSLGIQGTGTLSEQQAVDAMVAQVNRAGGVLGRKLLVAYHSFDTATAVTNPSQTANEICADYRDDHPVFAVLFTVPTHDLRECLAAMGTPLIGGDGGTALVPAAAYAAHGGSYFYAPNAITVERLAKLFITSLVERDFHEKWDTNAGRAGGVAPVKLGVIHVDSPDTNALYAAYAKELAKHGLRFTDEVTYAQNLQAGLAVTQNAVLKFRADGITHVYGASAFFLQDAENQQYRPRYAYLPGLGALGAANSPAAQMNGAMTVGWEPTLDVDQAEDPGDTPAAASCRAVMSRAGMKSTARADLNLMYTVCDLVSVFRAALDAGGAPSVAAFRRGYESLGTTFRTALSFSAVLRPGHHYGVDAVRDMAWDSPCGCLRYTSRRDRS